MINFSHVYKSINGDKHYTVKDFSLQIQTGETLVLLGSSGAGKTTVLKMINRLTELTKGNIEIDGCNIQQHDPVELRRNIGYVFQGIGLFPHFTVAENISIILRLTKQPPNKQQQRVNELLELVGLSPDTFANRYPRELSGGQQQRVGVARALAANPDYLLMDEPFAALDTVTRNDLQLEILRLKKQLDKTIVFVTHDIYEALRLADRLAVMHNGELIQVGTKIQLIQQPATTFVQELFQKAAQQVQMLTKYFEAD